MIDADARRLLAQVISQQEEMADLMVQIVDRLTALEVYVEAINATNDG